MPEIGATLREARMRARIDVSEIEAQTKIRAKYLRALENEEWSLLPGRRSSRASCAPTPQALGLDGKALVEEYRAELRATPATRRREPIVASPTARARRAASAPSGPSRGYMVAGRRRRRS